MKIVTYNMRFGGASKDHWQRTIEEFDPDIFLVQETFNPADHHPAGNNWCHNTVWHAVQGLNWGSAVYVKDCVPRLLDIAGFEGSVAGAIVEGLSGCAGGRLSTFQCARPEARDISGCCAFDPRRDCQIAR